MTEEDVRNAEKIFGKDISALKGKSTRTKPIPVRTDIVAIPRALKVQHQKIELCANIMFIQNIPFLTTISQCICYQTVQAIPNQTTKLLTKAFDAVFCIYNSGGFTVSKIYCDPEFCHLKDVMADIDIELCCVAAQEHVWKWNV